MENEQLGTLDFIGFHRIEKISVITLLPYHQTRIWTLICFSPQLENVQLLLLKE